MEVESGIFIAGVGLTLVLKIIFYTALQMAAVYWIAQTRRVNTKVYVLMAIVPMLAIPLLIILLAMPHREVLERLEKLENPE